MNTLCKMKREIKFRVWTGQQMDYNIMAGFLGAFYVQGIDERDSASMSQFNTKYPEGCSVMQFTGLKDKRGREIYEWDIVLYDDLNWNVVWNYDRWDLKRGNDLHTYYIGEDNAMDDPHITVWEDLKVIGNIYENPELLK